MLPVQIWHERDQEAEAIEFGDQARVGDIGRGEVRVGTPREEWLTPSRRTSPMKSRKGRMPAYTAGIQSHFGVV